MRTSDRWKYVKATTPYITKVASVFTVATGCLVLSGWFFNIPSFKSILPGIISMKFNTAVCFILSGIALYLLDAPEPGKSKKRVAFVCSWIILFAGFLNLSEYISGYNLGIDELLWKEGPGTFGTTFPGRMSMTTAINFILLGAFFLTLQKRKYHWLIQALLIVMISGSLLVILNHLAGVSFLNAIPQISDTALHTAILFIVLGFGIFCSWPLGHPSFSFQKKIAGFFALVTMMLVIVFFAISKNNEHAVDTAQWVDHTNQVLLQAQELRMGVAEMQNATKDFLITGTESYLPVFSSTVADIGDRMAGLKEITKDNATQQTRIDSLGKLITGFIKSRTELLRISRIARFSDEKIEQILKEGKDTTDGIRTLISAIRHEEKLLLATRKAENERSIQNSSRVITLFQFTTIILFLATLVIIYDNTRKRNQAEEQLNEFKHFFNNSNDLCLIANMGGYFETINPNLEKVLGFSEKELTTKPFINFVHPDDIAATLHEFERQQSGAVVMNFTHRFLKKDGSYVWIDWNSIPNSATGKIYAIGRDITDRKNAEEQLKEYKYFFDNSNDLCLIANEEGYFETITPKVEEVLGYSNAEISQIPFIELVYPDDVPSTLLNYDKLKSGATVINFANRYRKKDGSYVWFEWNTSPNSVTRKLYCIARNITERKMLEDKLKQFNRELEQKVKERTLELSYSERRFRALIENSSDAISLVDASGKVIYQSPAAETITGLTMEDRNAESNFANIHPGDIEKAHKLYDELVQAPGIDIPVLFRVIHKKGHYVWIEGTATNLIHDESVGALVINFHDVTHRIEAEENLKKYAEELKSSNTELERFAYIASHDLQEPLRMVNSFMSLLEERMEGQLDETNKQYLHFAVDGANRMKALIQDLLLYSRIGVNQENFTNSDLNEIMQYTIRLMEEDIKKNQATITVSHLPVISVNKTLISQLFVNLVSNALKYHGDKDPKIEVGCAESPAHWTFYVKDNGIGIDFKFFDKIFIIFQRLHNKSEYSGTGIGLAICKKIVDIHKGKIWVESETGKGSSFYFSIPKQHI